MFGVWLHLGIKKCNKLLPKVQTYEQHILRHFSVNCEEIIRQLQSIYGNTHNITSNGVYITMLSVSSLSGAQRSLSPWCVWLNHLQDEQLSSEQLVCHQRSHRDVFLE